MSELVITRVFNAPRDVVFKACSEASGLVKWWGGGPDPIEVEKFDFVPEGKFIFHSILQVPHYGMFEYKEIVSPEKIEFISSFSDKDGNLTRAYFHESFPLQILHTWTFEEGEEGTTVFNLHAHPRNATEGEVEFYSNMLPRMQPGFNGIFDKLDAYLAKL